ncbi:M56 family metallopeptidase [Pseudoalteromonas sp. APC 3356]|jgi:Zn-dependent protease with chaperone function|uniref:M56 family metallopeptidase n=1 Tax=Pseudoalteromonas TaxID=53246 RepID=UPI00030D246B|nr:MULTISPECIES: M56 family metallopeptidase [Pseudoalteromonas]MDN3407189.1 M56 family metallopeptidase [Pseudoalteromonas sp. APC 3218]MDN3436302.1 M56 family metallopeptidase [Pseudoalteromonas sp. APC 3356]TMO23787.1 M56 family peptidase [Pseudoalteromonas sp. S4741]
MIVGNWAVFLNLASAAVTAFICVIILISFFHTSLCKKITIFQFTERKFMLWLTISSPWWISLLCAAVFWQAHQNQMSNWLQGVAHWHHLEVFSVYSWHSVLLISAACLMTSASVHAFFSLNRHSSAMSSLLALSNTQPHKDYPNQSVHVIEHLVPEAFTVGFFNPKVYITSGLQALDEKTVHIVIQHELAHLKARDPLFKTLFSLFSWCFPSPTRAALQQSYTALTEQIADVGATQYFDGLDVAQALINVARFQRQQRITNDNIFTSHFSNEQITQRIQTLLTPIPTTPKPLLIVTLFSFMAIALFTLSTVDSVHHLIETFFIH